MPLFSARGKGSFVPVVGKTLESIQDLGRHATEAALASLGKLVQQDVDVKVPRVAIVPSAHIDDQFQHLAATTFGASFRFGGGLDGAVAVVLDKENARRLVDLLLGNEDGTTKRFGDLETSALAEMANITLNNALNAVGTENGLRFTPEVPQVATKVDASFWRDLAPERDAAHMVLVETTFEERSRGVEGTLLLLFEIAATE